MAETRDFKFGTQLGYTKTHRKTHPEKSGRGLGLGKLCNGRAVLLALTELLVEKL